MRVRLGCPRVVPSFRCPLFVIMSSSMTPETPSVACAQCFTDDFGLHSMLTGSAFSTLPASTSARQCFSGLHDSHLLRPDDWLASLCGSDPPARADGDLYSQACVGSVALPNAGYNYGGNWAIPSTRLPLARAAASFAAPSRHVTARHMGAAGPSACEAPSVLPFHSVESRH